MKHELIKTDDYLLVVSNEEIREQSGNDTIFNKNINKITAGIYQDDDNQFKVLAHLPLNGSPYLDGVDVLPGIEYDLHIYDAIGYAGAEGHPDPHAFSERQIGLLHGYVEGFEKAKETYKYTEEDLRKAIDMATTCKHEGTLLFFNANEIMQSLNQPKLPIFFECQMITVKSYKDKMGNVRSEKTFQGTFTNSEGRTEWVGKYLF